MRTEYECIDGHTCGNPVRIVKTGHPPLKGKTIAEKRLHFLKEYDWIRKGLMFEPRGHDMMSGSFLYPPTDPANDCAVLFIETSGCLPMCGHGTIGLITIGIEEGLIVPKKEGHVNLETPAGLVKVSYKETSGKVESVRIINIPSFLHSEGLKVDCPDLGQLAVDVAYGGNFYAIVDPQQNFKGIQEYSAGQLVKWSRILREKLNEQFDFIHPQDPTISGLSHLLWTGDTLHEGSTARNAVFYGEKAIDRSPCGTGTSARMAQWHAKGKLQMGEEFIHESIIGSKFIGRIEEEVVVDGRTAIVPSIEGWAKTTGYNRIILDQDDPFVEGFSVV